MVYDLRQPPGSRLVRLLVDTCTQCKSSRQQLSPVVDDEVYNVVTLSYLADGGGGFTMLNEGTLGRRKGPIGVDALVAYVRKRSPIVAGLQDRSLFLGRPRRYDVELPFCTGSAPAPPSFGSSSSRAALALAFVSTFILLHASKYYK